MSGVRGVQANALLVKPKPKQARTLEGLHAEILAASDNSGRYALARALRHVHRHEPKNGALRKRLRRAQQRHQQRVDYGFARRRRG